MSATTERPLFDPPVSCSNLVEPDFGRFLDYSRTFFEARRYTNDGPLVRELERRLAEFHETERCITFASGFWAIVLAIKALALAGRDEVVMPSLTYRRMTDVIGWTGLVPRFCEVEPETLAMSAKTVAAVMSDSTALVMAMHPIVNCCPIDELEALADEHGVPLLVDAVESGYETYTGRKVGGFGRAEAFSLHACKLINGFEGGYITTNDHELADRLLRMRGFGFLGHDNVVDFGMNAKLNEIHAAVALASLDDLRDQVVRNRERYRAYQAELADLPGIRLLEFDESEQVSYKNIVIELEHDWPLDRDETVAALNRQGILARAYYAPPLHRKRYAFEVRFGELPVTERLASRFVSMPCGARVTTDDIAMIASFLRSLAAEAAVAGGASR